MIDASGHVASQQVFNNALIEQLKLRENLNPSEFPGLEKPQAGKSFGNMIGELVNEVAEKGKIAEVETNRMLLGQTDNIHQSMIAVQESSLAFTMLVEVRNKLVQSYQELMKMPV